jgi:ribonucleotide reductase alpha subunit
MRTLIDMAADRGPFICQSQSLNLWLEEPSYASLTAMHFYSWQKGLKTGIYYLRRKPKHQPQQFTIHPSKEDTNAETETETETIELPPILGEGECEMCSA